MLARPAKEHIVLNEIDSNQYYADIYVISYLLSKISYLETFPCWQVFFFRQWLWDVIDTTNKFLAIVG